MQEHIYIAKRSRIIKQSFFIWLFVGLHIIVNIITIPTLVKAAIMRPAFLSIFLSAFCLTSFAQTEDDIAILLDKLSGQSEYITKDSSVLRLLDNGEDLLPYLSKQFTDSTKSKIFSKCAGRLLTRGELAIIMADRIEGMPYFTLTGLQNCTLESCDNNPNFVEYYLEFIRFRGMTKLFQKRYDEWLVSSDRKKYRKDKSSN